VKLGDLIAVMSAMKMETIVTATIAGVVEEVYVSANESLSAGDMIAKLENKN
jgi:pyruvate carboxylase